MSTRATYQIDFTTFYIHDDGYPQGAAEYFAKALDPANRVEDRAPNASLADDFARANPRAEHTWGHEAHGDTEYRYVVRTMTVGGNVMNPAEIVARHRRFDSEEWRLVFKGTLDEFIKLHVT